VSSVTTAAKRLLSELDRYDLPPAIGVLASNLRRTMALAAGAPTPSARPADRRYVGARPISTIHVAIGEASRGELPGVDNEAMGRLDGASMFGLIVETCEFTLDDAGRVAGLPGTEVEFAFCAPWPGARDRVTDLRDDLTDLLDENPT
jgi:hypothetical protein